MASSGCLLRRTEGSKYRKLERQTGQPKDERIDRKSDPTEVVELEDSLGR